jgi:hypothetical protein
MHKKMSHVRFGLVRFSFLFFVFFILIASVWTFIVPFYNYLAVGVAGLVFSLIENPDTTKIRAQADAIAVYRHEEGLQEPVLFSGFSRYIYFGIVPLLALFSATPGLRREAKLERMLIGLIILFIFHVVYLVSSIELTYVFIGCRKLGGALYRLLDWTQVFVRVMWEMLPVIIWFLLMYKTWRKQSSNNGD